MIIKFLITKNHNYLKEHKECKHIVRMSQKQYFSQHYHFRKLFHKEAQLFLSNNSNNIHNNINLMLC